MNKVEKARNRASELLSTYNLDSVPVDVDYLVAQSGVQLRYEDLDQDTSGLLVKSENESVIVGNAHHPLERRRFAVAHVFAHYLLHASAPTVYIDDATKPGADDSHPDSAQEAEANAFAGELLMPSAMLMHDVNNSQLDFFRDHTAIDDLAAKYLVTTQVATVRLSQLGLLAGVPSIAADTTKKK